MEDPDQVPNSKTDTNNKSQHNSLTSTTDPVPALHSQPNPENISKDNSSTSTSKEKDSNTFLSPQLNSSWSTSSTTQNASTSGWYKIATKKHTLPSSTTKWDKTSSSSLNKDKCWGRNAELKQSILHKYVHNNSQTKHNQHKSVTFESSKQNLISNTNQARQSSYRQYNNYSQTNNNQVKKNTKTSHSIKIRILILSFI